MRMDVLAFWNLCSSFFLPSAFPDLNSPKSLFFSLNYAITDQTRQGADTRVLRRVRNGGRKRCRERGSECFALTHSVLITGRSQ